MFTTLPPAALASSKSCLGDDVAVEGMLQRLETAFKQQFAVADLRTGSISRINSDWPGLDVSRLLPHCERLNDRVEVLEDHAPLLVLAVPLQGSAMAAKKIALTVLLTDVDPTDASIASAARVVGVEPSRLATWAIGRRAWPAHAAVPLAEALAEVQKVSNAETLATCQLTDVSSQLLSTFEELNLLHQLTEELSLGQSEHELVEQAVERLADVTPCEGVVACLYRSDESATVVAGGRSPLDDSELPDFFERLGPQATCRAIVLNADQTSSPTWAYPGARQVVTAPILANDQLIGWIGIFNHHAKPSAVAGDRDDGFGSIEASLLSSVATLIGVHTGNQSLLNEKTTLFERSVQALTSAIDAKDRYTCGHSDRVARVAVRLAQQLQCSDEDINAIYLGGLLHDIGKIGVEDRILRKSEQLTDQEFDQIKLHPTLGEQILRGVPQLSHVLPIVLHHHESWDGAGYPDGLVGEETPLLARITAVADAFDAMGSDRPYRKGMPIEVVESILREGAGQQWDPRVIDAYLAVRDEILAISRVERDPLDLDVSRWGIGEPCTCE